MPDGGKNGEREGRKEGRDIWEEEEGWKGGSERLSSVRRPSVRSFVRISKSQLFAATDPFNRHLPFPSLPPLRPSSVFLSQSDLSSASVCASNVS